MGDRLILDLDDELGTVAEVRSLNLKFERYELRRLDDQDEIVVGLGKVKEDQWSNFKKYDLLFSMFGIINGSLPLYFSPESLKGIMPDTAVIKWCQGHGLPYLAKNLPEADWPVPGFRINSFRYRLAVLYSYFLLWKALNDDDTKAIDLNMSLVGLKPEEFQDHTVKRLEIKDSLARYISTSSVSLCLSFNKKQEEFLFELTAWDLMDVCRYQLATLVTLKRADWKQNLKQCKECQRFFWGHGNKRYCPRCDRRTIWSRRQRAGGQQ